MKRSIFVIIMVVVLCLALAACSKPAATPDQGQSSGGGGGDTASSQPADTGGDTKWRVAVSLPKADNAWQAKMLEHLLAETANDPEIEWTIKNAADDADQTNTLVTYKGGGYDVIMCLPGDGTLQTSTLNEIYDTGVPVFIIDRAIENDKYTCFLADDNYDCLAKITDFVGAWFEGQENIKGVNLRSYTGVPIDISRYNGLADTILKYPNLELIGEGDGEFNSTAGYNAMTDLLAAHKHIDFVITQDDEAVLGAMKAIEQENRTDVQLIVGVGFTKATIENYRTDSTIHKASATYSPFIGAQGAQAVREFLRTGTIQKDIIEPSVLITKDNVEQYLDQAYGD